MAACQTLSSLPCVGALLRSRLPLASILRVALMTLVAHGTFLLLLRLTTAPDVSERPSHAQYRNGSKVNAKALVSHVVSVLEHVSESLRATVQPLADSDVLDRNETRQLLEQISARVAATVRQSLLLTLPHSALHGPIAHSDRESLAVPLTSHYRDDVHRVVWFDQWLEVDSLAVWITDLMESRDLILAYKLKMVTLSVCVSVAGRPHMSVIAYPFRPQSLPPASAPATVESVRPWTVHWGLAERGNDLQLRVAGAHRFLPERYGAVIDGHLRSVHLARAAFGSDCDLYYAGGVSHQLLAVLSLYADLALYSQPVAAAHLCPAHTFFAMYGGRVTDLSTGDEVNYSAVSADGTVAGGVMAALYYHRPLLQLLQNATATV